MPDDLLPETFLRVYRNIGTFREADCLAAWVYPIARKMVRDYYYLTSKSNVTLPNAENESDDDHEPHSAIGAIRGWMQ